MAKQDKSSRSGFVIKLSSETAQKLAEEEQQAKSKAIINTIEPAEGKEREKNDAEQMDTDPSDGEQDKSLEVSSSTEHNEKDNVVSKGPEIQPVDAQDSSSESERSSESSKDSEKPAVTATVTSNEAWGAYAPYITYEGEEAIYTDPNTKQRYTWSQETNSWLTKQSEVPDRVYSYEDDTHVYTEPDGSKSFWDDEKKAWIPKVDDDFLAYYQMSYGFVDNKAEDKKEVEKPKEVQKKEDNPTGAKRKPEPQWFEPPKETNTKVYVSNLPLDLTEEEFVDFMQKCGLVERDPSTQKMRVKLYIDKEQNCFKGDALCTYIKIESVDLALKLLDGSDFKGNKIKVERAHFELKGEYNPALKPKKKRKKELEKIKKMQQKLFDWRPEKFIGERSKHERVVIVKNLFHPTDFDKEVQLILDYQQDLREECSKSGEVRKVVIYDRHPEGVAQITMKEPEMADAVVALINGRWFGKRQITAEIWDGRTKYRIAETDADINNEKKRLEKWEKFLEGKEEVNKDAGSDKPANEVPATTAEEPLSTDSTLKTTEQHVSDESTNKRVDMVISSDTVIQVDTESPTDPSIMSEVSEAAVETISGID